MNYKYADIDGLKVFYREAGDPRNPAMVLLHGFPSSSHMYRNLMAELADKFYLIAPDYPGFGNTDAPSPDAVLLHVRQVVRGGGEAAGIRRR